MCAGNQKSTEINGAENLYTAEFWEYDSRIGRRWNLDPKPAVGISEYSTFENNPIWHSDPLGDTVRPGAGFWVNGWEGLKQGGRDTKNFVKSLRTKEGWGNLAEGMQTMVSMDPASIGKRAVMAQNMIEGAKDIPNMNADQWGHALGYGTEKIAETVLLSKGASLVGKGATYLSRFSSAEKYLEAVNMSGSFESGTARFSFKFGEKGFIYHEAENAALKTPWSAPQSLSSPGEAFVKLALNYKSSTNFASYKFSLKNWGLFVEGKAAQQGITLGGGTQSLRTPFSLKTNLQSKFWWKK